MTNYIASVDCGNGNTCAMIAGSKKSISFPSIRARITAQTLGLRKGHELDLTSAVWRGDNYAVGDNARLGVKSGSVDLTLLCPPAMYNELKKQR